MRKSYGLVQQKLWFGSTRPPFSVKNDKNEPVLGGQQPIAEQQREKRGTEPCQNWLIRNPLSTSFKKSDSQRG